MPGPSMATDRAEVHDRVMWFAAGVAVSTPWTVLVLVATATIALSVGGPGASDREPAV